MKLLPVGRKSERAIGNDTQLLENIGKLIGTPADKGNRENRERNAGGRRCKEWNCWVLAPRKTATNCLTLSLRVYVTHVFKGFLVTKWFTAGDSVRRPFCTSFLTPRQSRPFLAIEPSTSLRLRNAAGYQTRISFYPLKHKLFPNYTQGNDVIWLEFSPECITWE